MHTSLRKTLTSTFLLSIGTSSCAYLIQKQAQRVTDSCSYLDPISVDIAAFLFGLYLIIEGCLDIYRHRDSTPRQQINRSIRVSIGCSILTIHIMQFIHK